MRASTIVTVVPVVAAAVLVALANRTVVTFSLDPFSTANPAIAFSLPLYLLVFISLILGALLGGGAVWLRRAMRGRPRRPVPVGDHALDALEPPAAKKDSPAA